MPSMVSLGMSRSARVSPDYGRREGWRVGEGAKRPVACERPDLAHLRHPRWSSTIQRLLYVSMMKFAERGAVVVTGFGMMLLCCEVAHAQRMGSPVHLARATQLDLRDRGPGDGIDSLGSNRAAGVTHVSTIVVAPLREVPIAAKDNRGRNALIGALIGGGLVGAYYLRDCYRNDCHVPIVALYPAAIGAGVGAFVGVLLTPTRQER